jgi:hypothetical protein
MNQEDERVLRAMIQESGEMWLAVRDRVGPAPGPIIICRSPRCAYYLYRTKDHADGLLIDGWVVEECPLRKADATDFFAAFGSHWPYWHGATIRGAEWRAFIKNGRKEGWSISLDMKMLQAGKEAAQSLQKLANGWEMVVFHPQAEEASDQ